MNNLLSLIGKDAYLALVRGLPLNVWRRSSPHNWFINDEDGKTLWHSDEITRMIPDRSLFKKPKHSKTKIWNYGGSDGGKPESSFYFLKKEFRSGLL